MHNNWIIRNLIIIKMYICQIFFKMFPFRVRFHFHSSRFCSLFFPVSMDCCSSFFSFTIFLYWFTRISPNWSFPFKQKENEENRMFNGNRKFTVWNLLTFLFYKILISLLDISIYPRIKCQSLWFRFLFDFFFCHFFSRLFVIVFTWDVYRLIFDEAHGRQVSKDYIVECVKLFCRDGV